VDGCEDGRDRIGVVDGGDDPHPVAVVSNAGFETVCGADRTSPPNRPAHLSEDQRLRLEALLARHGLERIVSARLPLDLTPMASLEVYRDAICIVAEGVATVIVGLVPFTGRLALDDARELETLSRSLLEVANRTPLALVIDGGPAWEHLGRSLVHAGLPVFATMEDALAGLDAQ